MGPRQFRWFATRENGAAAFDWVILAVGIFGLGLAIYSVITTDLDARRPDATPEPAAAQPPETGEPALLYPYFDAAWHREQLVYYAGLSDADLRADYAAQYGVATGAVNTRIGADLLAVIEAEMTRRGLALPENHDSADLIHRRLSGAPAAP